MAPQKVGIIGLFFQKVGKSRALDQKVGKSRKSRACWSACSGYMYHGMYVSLGTCIMVCMYLWVHVSWYVCISGYMYHGMCVSLGTCIMVCMYLWVHVSWYVCISGYHGMYVFLGIMICYIS